MSLPCCAAILTLLLLPVGSAPAMAGPLSEPPALHRAFAARPAHLSAPGPAAPPVSPHLDPAGPLAPRPRHVPQPFPDDGDLDYRGDGPGPFGIAAGVMGASAVILALVAAGAHARHRGALDDGDTSASESARRARNVTGYTALGLAGGAGVCMGLSAVW